VPRYCLAHLLYRESVYPNHVRYRYDLWPVPVIVRPAHGRTKDAIECGTCGRRVTYQVSSIAEVRRHRRSKLAEGLAVLITGAGWITASVLLSSRTAPWIHHLIAWGLESLLCLFLAALVLLCSTPWPNSVRLRRPGRRHTLRPPGSTEHIETLNDTYVM
jgi:hypothetical protein